MQCFITIWNTEKRVESMTCSRVFLTNFEVFHLVMKHCVKCFNDITSQIKWFYKEKLRMQNVRAAFHLISQHSLNINFLCIVFMNYWWVWEVTLKRVNNYLLYWVDSQRLLNIHRFQFPQNNFLGVKPPVWLSAFSKHWYITLVFRAVLIHLIKKSWKENFSFGPRNFFSTELIHCKYKNNLVGCLV